MVVDLISVLQDSFLQSLFLPLLIESWFDALIVLINLELLLVDLLSQFVYQTLLQLLLFIDVVIHPLIYLMNEWMNKDPYMFEFSSHIYSC